LLTQGLLLQVLVFRWNILLSVVAEVVAIATVVVVAEVGYSPILVELRLTVPLAIH